VGSIQSQKRKGYTPNNGTNVQQQTTALPTHVWRGRMVHKPYAKDIGSKLLLGLLKSECFKWATIRRPSIVNHYVKTTGNSDNSAALLLVSTPR
jgi:hypothetical protein